MSWLRVPQRRPPTVSLRRPARGCRRPVRRRRRSPTMPSSSAGASGRGCRRRFGPPGHHLRQQQRHLAEPLGVPVRMGGQVVVGRVLGDGAHGWKSRSSSSSVALTTLTCWISPSQPARAADPQRVLVPDAEVLQRPVVPRRSPPRARREVVQPAVVDAEALAARRCDPIGEASGGFGLALRPRMQTGRSVVALQRGGEVTSGVEEGPV